MSETGEGIKPAAPEDKKVPDAPENMSKEVFKKPVDGVLPIEQGQVERAVGEAIATRTGFPVPKTEEERIRLVAERSIGGGAGWLFDDPRDLASIRSEKLMRLMEGLENMHARGILTDPARREEVLRERYLQIDDWRISGEVDSQEADECQTRISQRLQERTGFVSIEDPRNPESVTRGILTALNQIERDASGEKKKLEEFSKEKLDEIKKVIDAISPEVDKNTGKDEVLSGYLGREIRLKEKLGLALEARRRLHNRKIEIIKADGDLKQLGVGEKLPLAEGVAIVFTNIEAVHWHILLHLDDLFKDEIRRPDPEIAVPVAEAMNLWKKVGEAWDQEVLGGTSYLKALNSAENIQKLRNAIGKGVGRKAEEIARDIFTVTLTFDRWDKGRKKLSGKNDPRDLMYFDLKRAMDFAENLERLRPAGPEDTIGAYFAEIEQGKPPTRKERVKVTNPDGTEGKKEVEIPEDTTPEQRRRLKILQENKKEDRSVLPQYSLKELPKGHLVGDLWTSGTTDKVEGAPKMSLNEVAQRYGWKKIPFLRLFEDPYSGYFGYFLGMSEAIDKLVKKTGWDFAKDGLASPHFWHETMALFDRMRTFSPSLNTLDIRQPGDAKTMEERIMKWRMVFALGILWDGSHLAKTGKGVLGKVMRTEVGNFTYQQVRDIYDALGRSGFLSKKYLGQLKSLVSGRGKGYNFSMGDIRTGKSSQMDYNMVKWGI